MGDHLRILRFATAAILFWPTATASTAQQHASGQIIGRVVDANGAAINGASIFVHRATSPYQEAVRLLAHSVGHGNFSLRLPEGGYDILVAAPGFAGRVETVGIFPRRSITVEWKLAALKCDMPGINCDRVQ